MREAISKRATFLRKLENPRADQRLYELSHPIVRESRWEGDPSLCIMHVVVSACSAMGRPETYVFAADGGGEITDWSELDGSFRDGLDHAKALRGAGYEVSP